MTGDDFVSAFQVMPLVLDPFHRPRPFHAPSSGPQLRRGEELIACTAHEQCRHTHTTEVRCSTCVDFSGRVEWV